MKKIALLLVCLGSFAAPSFASDVPDAANLFNKKCKMCHAMDKKKVGPAVNAMNTDAEVLRNAIKNGGKMMPKFAHKLDEAEIEALVAFVQSKHAE